MVNTTDLCFKFSLTQQFFLFINSCLTLPNTFQFHQSKSLPHFSTLDNIVESKSEPTIEFHASCTISSQVGFDNHISSKRNNFLRVGMSNGARTTKRGLWFEESQCQWWTRDPGNFRNHPLVARPLSSLSHIELPFSKCLAHVNFDPTYPRSIKPHSSITSRNSCIWKWDLVAPPNFLSCLVISLKSPKQSYRISGLE